MVAVVFYWLDGTMCPVSKSRKYTEASVREWLARRLDLEEIPNPLWTLLLEEGLVQEVLLDAFEDAEQELLRKARQLLKFSQKMEDVKGGRDSGADTVGAKQRRVPDFPKGDPVRQRAEAVSLYWSKMANQDDEVVGFRERALGGTTISAEEAEDLRASPAAAIFPLEWFKDKGVPLVGHRARVTRSGGSHVGGSRRSGDQLEIKWEDGRLCLPLEDDEQSNPFQLIIDPQNLLAGMVPGERPPVTVRGKERPSVIIAKARQEAVLSELEQVAVHLTRQFPWEQEEAVQFVLTGEPVQVPPIYEDLSDSDESYPSYIKLTVAPWVPAETVGEVYKARRKELTSVQTTSPKRLAIFRFVMTHPKVKVVDEGRSIEGPSWRSLMKAWNESLLPDSQWRAEDERNFRRDFKEAFNRLVPSSDQRL